jgi:erythromycin esterase
MPTLHQMPGADPTVVRWIQQHVASLRTVDPGGSAADLAALPQIVGQASLVSLGEETHGTHEFIAVRARLAEYLIATWGFTTFVMENDWESSRLLDAYLNGEPGNITSIMSQSLFGSWQTQEYRALFEWLRAYNANPARSSTVHFLAMDCQEVSQSDFDAGQGYIQQVALDQAASVQALFAPLIVTSLPSPYSTNDPLDAAQKRQYQTQAERVYDLLQAHQQGPDRALRAPAIRRRPPGGVCHRAVHHLPQRLDPAGGAGASLPARRLHGRERGVDSRSATRSNPKLIVWAHDAHIANATTYGSQDGRNLGGELRAHCASANLAIGSTLFTRHVQDLLLSFGQGSDDSPSARLDLQLHPGTGRPAALHARSSHCPVWRRG